MTDPVSWLQIEQGWDVSSADGTVLGTVAQVAGDLNDDIFDGLAVKTGSRQLSYVPGEQVGSIFPGKVTLKITALEAQSLAPYRESPPQTTWRPGTASLGSRISSWLQGKR